MKYIEISFSIFKIMLFLCVFLFNSNANAQVKWTNDGDLYYKMVKTVISKERLTYMNIYQERYMGLPQKNREDFIAGSPITYAKNLEGNLLYIHGTGDDNVHYQNAESLVNELIKHNKLFQFMPYPNRSHEVREGEGTKRHLSNLYTTYLKMYCPPDGR